MLSDSVSSSSEETTIYRPISAASLSTITLAVFIALPVIIVGGGLALRSGQIYQSLFCFLLPTLLLLLYCYYIYRAFAQMYLAVSPNGLEYHTAGLTIQTPWHNIDRLLDEHSSPRLLLKQPSVIESQIGALLLAPGSARHDAPADLLIPLLFFHFSRRTELGQHIQRYAPHLFKPTG